ncbi:hypothetical protein WJX72_010879 [[Myrmecia] bisecta]|uniref:DHHA1 domain-containing protein n=1 Tax=[Myrmecia] bisecta TaxID=41462 RepID=A0AAW1PQB1_9CHLO
MRTPAVVLYHYPCHDGVFAALAAYLGLQASGRAARFVPHRVFQACALESLKLQGSEDVFLLDYAGPPGFAVQLAQTASRVMVLDHHKTAAEQFEDRASLPANLEVHMDMERSGATIALDYFSPQVTDTQRQLFKYIEDGDLWRWQLPDSKAFYAGMADMDLEYNAGCNPGIFDQLLHLRAEQVILKGKAALEKQRRQIDAALGTCFRVRLGGASGIDKGWGEALAVRADDVSHLRSQLGNALAEKSAQAGLRAMGVVAYMEAAMNDGAKVKVSLRSIGDEDTTVITQAYRGGGHRNASSCIVDLTEFESWKTT